MNSQGFRLLLMVFWLLPLTNVNADEFRPALLVINEAAPGWYSITWKRPLDESRRAALQPRLPSTLEQVGPVARSQIGQVVIEQSTWRGEPGALAGAIIEIPELKALPIEVIIKIALANGSEHLAVLRSTTPRWTVPAQPPTWTVAGSYWQLGTIHILEGFDHLLFVLALILLVRGWWPLLKAITAFTVAHSITLALATLGLVNIPGPPTEAVIALSILFLAVEIIHSREGRATLTERAPWLVSLSFGLVHGLGFAGALSEVGLPQSDISLALLMFNLGVETGQLLFVFVVVSIREILNRLPLNWPAGSWRIFPYAIGGTASFWVIERVASFS